MWFQITLQGSLATLYGEMVMEIYCMWFQRRCRQLRAHLVLFLDWRWTLLLKLRKNTVGIVAKAPLQAFVVHYSNTTKRQEERSISNVGNLNVGGSFELRFCLDFTEKVTCSE